MLAHDLSKWTECGDRQPFWRHWRYDVERVAKQRQAIAEAPSGQDGKFSARRRSHTGWSETMLQRQHRRHDRLLHLPTLRQHPVSQGCGHTDRPVRHLGAVFLHIGDGNHLGAVEERLVGFMFPFFRSVSDDHDRRRGKSRSLDS
ncbi:hypothetical protein NKI53_28805 [Mesorhizobium sp. M0586]